MTGITVAGLVGSSGNASNQLNTPVDALITYANDLYVVDYNNHRIQKYSFNTAVGKTVAGNGKAGLSPSQLYCPVRVVMDSNANLYISDAYNSRVQFWSNGAANGTTVAGVSGKTNNRRSLRD